MLDRIEDAIEDIKNGKMVIVVDDEDRENEGDLFCKPSMSKANKNKKRMKKTRKIVKNCLILPIFCL